MDNIFKKKTEELGEISWDTLLGVEVGRENLGKEMPVIVYRMFEYAMRDTLTRMFGKEKMIEILRKAGEKSGRELYKRNLDGTLPLNEFLAQLQEKLIELKIGVLRMEEFDAETGHAVLTVGEDLDCSGLPMVGETVCNYDEGFLTGILDSYTGKEYAVVEVDCWATGDRVCRFDAKVK